KNGKVVGDHHVGYPGEETLSNRATGMKPGEIVRVEPLFFEERDRERITQCEGDRRAGGRREVVRARLLLHPPVERHIAVSRERRFCVTRERNRTYAKAL